MSCNVNLTLVRATIMSSVRRTILAPGKVKNKSAATLFFTLSLDKFKKSQQRIFFSQLIHQDGIREPFYFTMQFELHK